MYQMPYQTTLLKRFKTDKIVNELDKLMAMGTLLPAKSLKGKTLDYIFTVPSYVKSLPIFNHPLFLANGKIVLDTRAYLKDQLNGESKVLVPNEYNFLLVRAILAKKWNSNDRQGLFSLDFATQVYSRWVCENLTKRLAMGPLEQIEIMAISCFFYLSLFGFESKGSDMFAKISQHIKVPPSRVEEIIGGEEALSNPINNFTADWFISHVKSKVQSPRMANLNSAFLYASICGSWYGVNGREVLASAFEYPPDLLSICYMGLTDRSYRKAGLTKIIEQTDNRGSGLQFLNKIKHTALELSDE